jgi:hypothetical protein
MALQLIRSPATRTLIQPWISTAGGLATRPAGPFRLNRPIQTTPTRKSMPSIALPAGGLDVSQNTNGWDATACTVELEIALGKGQVHHEEFLKTVAKLHGFAPSATPEINKTIDQVQATRMKRMMEVTISKIFPAGFGEFSLR